MKNETRYLSMSLVVPVVLGLSMISPTAFAQTAITHNPSSSTSSEAAATGTPSAAVNAANAAQTEAPASSAASKLSTSGTELPPVDPAQQVKQTAQDEAKAEVAGLAAARETEQQVQAAGITSPTLPSPPAPNVDTTPRLGDVRLAASANATLLTLEEAIGLTLQNNPQRAATRAALEAARARVGTARSAGGLQVGLSGSVGADANFGSRSTSNNNGGTGGTGGTGTTGSNPDRFTRAESIGLSAEFPLYTGGRVSSARRQAEFNARAQAAQTLQVEQDLVLQATNAYLNVLRADQLLQVADSNLAVSRERQRVATVRYEAGASARLDVYRANTTLAEAQQRRITAVNDSAQARANLNSLMGRLPEAPLRIEPIQTLTLRVPLPMEVNAGARSGATTGTLLDLQTISVQNRPQGEVARATVFAADAQVDNARAQRKPSLGLSLSGFLRNPASFLGNFAVSLGLGVAQTLFDSGRSRSQINEARALAQQARANFDLQVLGVANQIETSLVDIDTAQGQLASAEASVTEAQAALAAAQLGYEAGASTILDVNDAQTALLTQQTNAVNARFDLASAQAVLSSNTGVLTEEGQNAFRLALQQEQTRTQSPLSKQIDAENKARRKALGIPEVK